MQRSSRTGVTLKLLGRHSTPFFPPNYLLALTCCILLSWFWKLEAAYLFFLSKGSNFILTPVLFLRCCFISLWYLKVQLAQNWHFTCCWSPLMFLNLWCHFLIHMTMRNKLHTVVRTVIAPSDSWSLPLVHCLPKFWKTWVGIKPAISWDDSDRNTDFSIVLALGGTLSNSETLEQSCGNLTCHCSVVAK